MSDRVMVTQKSEWIRTLDLLNETQEKVIQLFSGIAAVHWQNADLSCGWTLQQSKKVIYYERTSRRQDIKGCRLFTTKFSPFLVLIGMVLVFQVFSFTIWEHSFMVSPRRLVMMILQVSIGVPLSIRLTQMIINTSIDFSACLLQAVSTVSYTACRF